MRNLDLKICILRSFPSQADFAVTVGEHESAVSRVLHGRRRLSDEEIGRWIKALKCDPTLFKSIAEQNGCTG